MSQWKLNSESILFILLRLQFQNAHFISANLICTILHPVYSETYGEFIEFVDFTASSKWNPQQQKNEIIVSRDPQINEIIAHRDPQNNIKTNPLKPAHKWNTMRTKTSRFYQIDLILSTFIPHDLFPLFFLIRIDGISCRSNRVSKSKSLLIYLYLLNN